MCKVQRYIENVERSGKGQEEDSRGDVWKEIWIVDLFQREAERIIRGVWDRAVTLNPISNEMRAILGLLLERKNTLIFVSKELSWLSSEEG